MKQETINKINKSILLNYLHSADDELSIEELSNWLEARTNGKYVIVRKDQIKI